MNILPGSHAAHNEFMARHLPGFQIEVSLAFWRDEVRAFYDPGAPSVEDRRKAIEVLAGNDVPVVMRIDPFLPRSPVAGGKTLMDFGLPEAQTLDDLEQLVKLAKRIGARHVVYSPAKVVQPRRRKMSDAMVRMKSVYCAMSAPGKPVWRGGSFRLPKDVADRKVVTPFLRICANHGVSAKFCMTNLIETP